ncbi:hypothetical protein ABT224_33465 [Streptomyces sp. NPDC001584]|uniref:hypothetical protein n=1 Tax=Streptomyces sp. NPDC001584 TaxID=3154521 RepID=UPI003333FA6B
MLLSKRRPIAAPRQADAQPDDDHEDIEHDGEAGSSSPPRETPAAEAAPAAPRRESGGPEQPQEPAPPAEYQGRLASVIAAIGAPHDRQGLAAASVEAEKLDQELTAQFGGQHSHTVNIREIRGWLALVTGHPADAARWYLHTTGLQIALHGAGHEAAQGSVARAIHTWQRVKNPADVVEVGTGLAKVVTAVLGEDGEASRYIQGRLARYQAQL